MFRYRNSGFHGTEKSTPLLGIISNITKRHTCGFHVEMQLELPSVSFLVILLITQTIYAYCGNSFFVRKKEHVERGSLLGNIAKREYNSL